MLTLLVLVQSALAATSVWATADVDALRWPDATVVSMKVVKGDELELLVTDGAKLRVRKGTDFGWVDATATSTTAPAAAPADAASVVTPTDSSAQTEPASTPAPAAPAPN